MSTYFLFTVAPHSSFTDTTPPLQNRCCDAPPRRNEMSSFSYGYGTRGILPPHERRLLSECEKKQWKRKTKKKIHRSRALLLHLKIFIYSEYHVTSSYRIIYLFIYFAFSIFNFACVLACVCVCVNGIFKLV